jgi:SAM-dependent methyltransferase
MTRHRSLLDGFDNPYSALEALGYDAMVAPAVLELFERQDSPLLRRLIDETPAGGAVLDVGCGGGQVALHLAGLRPDLRLTGVDLNPGQIARARRRANGRASFLEGDALGLPFEPASFDLVLSVASIKHWPDQPAGLAECLRVLRPGGALAIIEAERGCRLADARAFVQRWRFMPPGSRRLGLMFFCTYVSGQSIDLERARQLLAGLPLDDAHVERLPGTPGLVLHGRRPGEED